MKGSIGTSCTIFHMDESKRVIKRKKKQPKIPRLKTSFPVIDSIIDKRRVREANKLKHQNLFEGQRRCERAGLSCIMCVRHGLSAFHEHSPDQLKRELFHMARKPQMQRNYEEKLKVFYLR